MGRRRREDDVLAKVLDAYVEEVALERSFTEDTARNARRAVYRWCRFVGWSWDAFCTATEEDADRWIEELEAEKKPNVVAQFLWAVRAVYNLAVNCGDALCNPFAGKYVRRPDTSSEPVEAAELRRILALARADAKNQDSRVTYIIASLHIRCNLCYAEIASADVGDYSRGAGGAFLRCSSLKHGATVMALSAETADAIDEYLALRGDCEPHAALLLSAHKKRFTDSAMAYRMSRLCRRAGATIGRNRSITAGILELAKEEGATPAELVALSRTKVSRSRVLARALEADDVGGAELASVWRRVNEGLASPKPLAVGRITRDELLVAAMGADGIREVTVWPGGKVTIAAKEKEDQVEAG